ncbi:glycosyltransferase family 1 protein [Aaosphaeria arxii CBS 175.79]|uniref:UDP-N-acetylglucosamine transferase subunit ALG14 n=1 Tax=Aaosphaeria arxii CBS 175.79 TaxID=1450172 RepID=A0A6A5XYE1_9PLEO|nr:glycosyltransferase family 1 protein [Aaosphaeria arxii CBS 175.79]KAF2018182.1 glycosyltransferase family 1 protein [Aaosphaeria arxii CBS 175.79]
MAPQLTSLYTTSFLIALFVTLLVAACLRAINILPGRTCHSAKAPRKAAPATRILIVLGSGGHTHEMFHLLRDLDTSRYTQRTYIVSGGDAFSAQRAVEFEQTLEDRASETRNKATTVRRRGTERPLCVGAEHFNIATIPRARKIHQSLLTTPFTSLVTLVSAFSPLFRSDRLHPNLPPTTPYEIAAQDLPDLIITNGPATGVIVVLAALIAKFFNLKGCSSRSKCRTIYVESFARVKTLSLSAKLLAGVVDRFLVQWEELEGEGGYVGGHAEYWGILV